MNKIDSNKVICDLREVSKEVALRIDNLIVNYGSDDDISWDQYLADYGGLYEVFGIVAKTVNELIADNPEEIQTIFDLVEQWYHHGNEIVREAATIGFLENVICLNENQVLEDELVYPFMHEQTRFWANKVKSFWVNGTPITYDTGA